MIGETDSLWILYFGLGNSPMTCVSCIMLLHSVIFPFFPLFLTERRSESLHVLKNKRSKGLSNFILWIK